MNKECIEFKVISGEKEYSLTWLPAPDWPLDKIKEVFRPITQVHGVCMNGQNQILIVRGSDGKWILPGGTVQPGEDLSQTLSREFREEVNIEVASVRTIGLQLVKCKPGVDPNGTLFYQLRVICEPFKFLPHEEDPDTGKISEWKWISYADLGNYINWGPCGDSMFMDAMRLRSQEI